MNISDLAEHNAILVYQYVNIILDLCILICVVFVLVRQDERALKQGKIMESIFEDRNNRKDPST